MKINRFLTIAFIILLSFSTFAQKKVEVGVLGGYSYAMPKTTASQLAGNLNGFHLGPLVQYNINEKIGIQTGALYNYNNSIITKNSVGTSGTWKQNRVIGQSLDIPLHAVYSVPLADDFYVQIGAGPNFNYALNKYKQTEYYVESKIVDRLTEKGTSIYASPSNFNPLDVQAGLSVGLRYTGVSLRASYDWGITDRDKTTDGKNRENNIKISIGYTF